MIKIQRLVTTILVVLIIQIILTLSITIQLRRLSNFDVNEIKAVEQKKEPKQFKITIDWVPSPEYYGFFVAKSEKLYDKYGLNVTINYGSGAPVVANQVATQSIYAGTTTSDNILRQVMLGADFSRAVPILRYNPSVLVSFENKAISNLKELKNHTIGVNKQSSVYQQFDYILGKDNKIKKSSFKEYPIGWGGAAQMASGEVDAILAYATNASIDLKLSGKNIKELFFSDKGVNLYGLVLVFASKSTLADNNILEEDIENFIQATIEGYRIGESNPSLAVDSLIAAEPTLKTEKIKMAVERISELNKTKQADFSKLDTWINDGNIPTEILEKAKALYKE